MAMLALLAVVLSPLADEIVGWTFRTSMPVPRAVVARLALTTVLAPLAAGMIVRATFPAIAARIEKPVAVTAKVLVPLVVVVLLIVASPAMWALVGDGTLMAMIVFQAIALATGHLLGGPDPDHSLVLALSTACRHPAIALTIAEANFPGQRFAAAILLYAILAATTATPYLAWQRRRMRAPAGAVS